MKPPAISRDDVSEEEENDDADTRRLRARMERAMGEGSEDSEDAANAAESSGSASSAGEYEEEAEDLNDEQLEGSFHTESEDDGEDEEDDDEDAEDGPDDSDDSETLREGPLTAADIRMRAMMDRAMAAADARADIHPVQKSTRKAAVKGSSAETSSSGRLMDQRDQVKVKGKRKAESQTVDAGDAVLGGDDESWNLNPGFGPQRLLAATLAAAAKAEEVSVAKTQAASMAAQARVGASQKSKKKRRKVATAQNTSKTLG